MTVIQTFYGQLHYILDIVLPRSDLIRLPQRQHRLLACIEPCLTQGKDATKEVVTYRRTSTTIFVDLQVIGSVVGRVKRGNEWAIIDRSEDLARTAFVDRGLDED